MLQADKVFFTKSRAILLVLVVVNGLITARLRFVTINLLCKFASTVFVRRYIAHSPSQGQ